MKKQINKNSIITFSQPDPKSNNITVYHNHPDKSTEIIGNILPTQSSTEEYLSYLATNKNGEEILSPSSDFIAIEQRYNAYAKELAENQYMEIMLQEAELQSERKNSLQSLRNLKIRKLFNTKSINY